MTVPLLATKIHVPPAQLNWIGRAALQDRLNHYTAFRLTLISAPAGFGKTALVSIWLAQRDMAWAWLTLDDSDNDLARFITYVVAALQRVNPTIGQAVLAVLQSLPPPAPETLGTLLINDVLETEVLLILDDYQRIQNPQIHTLVTFLIDHQPPRFRLMLLSRHDPPLPVARWRAQGGLNEIGERDLRFTREETAAFLTDTMQLTLPGETIEALNIRTEGWVAGLQLAALSLRNQTDYGEFVETFGGSHRYVVDYLAQEVLQQQPPAVRNFLSQTSILDHLCAPLCDAVTGLDTSRTMLNYLEKANLFLIALDDRREWYRYHPLFAEFLRVTLDETQQRECHRHASRWFESQDMPEFALHHALLAEDWEDVSRFMQPVFESAIHTGHLATARHWLDTLPNVLVRGDARLAILAGLGAIFSGELASAEDYAALAAQLAGVHSLTAAEHGKLLLLRCMIAIGQQAYKTAAELAAQTLAAFSEDDQQWRLLALWALAEARERTRPITEAIVTLQEARRTGHRLERHVFAAMFDSFLAAALNHNAQRREAVTVCEQAVARHTDEAGRVLPVAAHILCQLGNLRYEANELKAAQATLEQGVYLTEQLGSESILAFGRGLLARVLFAQGKTDAAYALLASAQPTETELTLGDKNWATTIAVTLRLSEGDLAFAQRWAQALDWSPDDEPEYLRLETDLTLARVWIAERRLDEAEIWLARRAGFTEAFALCRDQITVHILQALTFAYQDRQSAALEMLATAVAMAAPQHYVRAFLDEAPLVMGLLPAVREAAPDFVDYLLAASADAPDVMPDTSHRPAPHPLVDSLSEREQEVLLLIAAGRSNQEIAAELVITVGTVKRHVHNILEKLSASRRTEAVAAARELGLLD